MNSACLVSFKLLTMNFNLKQSDNLNPQEDIRVVKNIDLEPVYDIAPPQGGIFKGMIFLTHMVVGIHW